MNSLNELEDYLNQNALLDINEMRQLRRSLQKLLKVLDNKIDSIINKTQPTKRCPWCNSAHTKRHGQTPKIRYKCLDCSSTFVESRSLLHYRRRYPDKILDMVITIRMTNKSISQIQDDLNISPQTYYKWKKIILEIFPQLEQRFAYRGKKTDKL